jgi:hypothetical protein
MHVDGNGMLMLMLLFESPWEEVPSDETGVFVESTSIKVGLCESKEMEMSSHD